MTPMPDGAMLWGILDDYCEGRGDLYVDTDGELSLSAAEQMLAACKDLLAERVTPVVLYEQTFEAFDSLIVACLEAYSLDELTGLWKQCGLGGAVEPGADQSLNGPLPERLSARDRRFLEGLESWLVWYVTNRAGDAQSFHQSAKTSGGGG